VARRRASAEPPAPIARATTMPIVKPAETGENRRPLQSPPQRQSLVALQRDVEHQVDRVHREDRHQTDGTRTPRKAVTCA
jgi:hypothetical protein